MREEEFGEGRRIAQFVLAYAVNSVLLGKSAS